MRLLNQKFFAMYLFVFFVSQGVSFAQESKFFDEKIYFNKKTFLENFEMKGNELLKNKKSYLDVSTAKKQLPARTSAVVNVKKTPKLNTILPSRDLIKHLNESTVVFAMAYDCGQCDQVHLDCASGYVIDEDGIIVTNHHVVEAFVDESEKKNIAMMISTHSGKVYLVTEILSTNKDSDIAIVKVDTKGDKLKALAIGDPAQQGDEIFVMSHPDEMLYYFTKGVVARNYMDDDFTEGRLLVPNMDITAEYAGGSSGAPVVDIYGNLVATVSSTFSVFYEPEDAKSLQMIVKQTKPVVLLNKMIRFKE